MTDEGYVCACCGKESWGMESDSEYDCPYFDEHGEHHWLMAWTTEKD
jgi:hypothetical protein